MLSILFQVDLEEGLLLVTKLYFETHYLLYKFLFVHAFNFISTLGETLFRDTGCKSVKHQMKENKVSL